ncbi:MAG: hypothetical protein IJM75_05020, partial [Ruminococcus sp.]|nr:hypothetical protein [Ruminococcus sp.]
MKKPIGKRIAGFLAAAALAVTSVSSSFTDVLRAKAAGAGGDFSLTEAELDALRDNKQYTNDLSASISFKNADGSTNTTALPDNTYYLLVHAQGKDSDSYTYADGASHDHYNLYEIENNGGSFSTGRFAVVPATQVNGGWSSPDGKSLDGKILKAKEGWLTVDAVTNDWGKDKYEVTGTIEDFKVEVTSKPSTQTRSNEFTLTATKAIASAEVQVTDYDDTPTTVQNGTTSRYFVLGYVVDGDATETSYKRADVKGWAIEEVDLTNSSSAVAAFTSFHKFGLDGSDAAAAAYTLGANDKVYIRVFSTTGKDLTTFKQCKDNANDDAVFDGIPDYIPGGDSQTLATFKHNKTEYKIALEFDAAPDFAADDYIYLRATAHHASEDDYYVEPLVFSGATQNIITVQDADINNWRNGNGGQGQRYNGNPSEDVKVEIVSATSDRSFSNIVKNEKIVAAAEGDIVDGFKVSYVGQEKSEDTETHTTTYTNTVRFTKVTATKGYTYKEILGNNGVNFGIVADKFSHTGHMQTNFAANSFEGSSGFRPDLSDPNAGSIYIAHFANITANKDEYDVPAFVSQTIVTEPSENLINLESISDAHPANYFANLYTEFPASEKLMTNDRAMNHTSEENAKNDPYSYYVVQKQMSSDEITNTVIDPMIKHMQSMSDTLTSQEANYTPILIDNKYIVDGTSYPEGVTLYVDGDKMLNNGQLPVMNISLKKGQNVVFNFDTPEYVYIGQYYIRTLVDGKWVTGMDDNGNDVYAKTDSDYGHTDESQVYHSGFNRWMDKYVTRNVTFNMNKAKSVVIDGTAGNFLVANDKSNTYMGTTTTGWLQTAGYFSKSAAEWHFVYSELEEIEPVSGVEEFSVVKVDENGDPVKGAVLTIKIEPTSAAEAIRLAEDNFSCADGKATYTDDTITWTTGEKPLIIKGMQNAKVTIKETTTPPGYETAAEATYTVKDGKLQDADGKEVTDGKIKIVDAKKLANVTFSKKAVAGASELGGADIVIYEGRGDGLTTKVAKDAKTGDALSWRSDKNGAKTFTLADGEYTLKESGDKPFQGSDGKWYNVNTSAFGFKIVNGEVVEPSANAGTNDDISYDKASATITIYDSLVDEGEVTFSKTNINGDELAGATLTVTQDDGDFTKTWTTKVGEDGKVVPTTFTLKDGTYTLKETGKDFTYNGVNYRVTESEIKFKVSNGALKVIDKQTVADNGGSISISETNKTVTIVDAETDATAVVISKRDVTSKEELAGATLTVTQTSGGSFTETWTTETDGEGKVVPKTLTLKDGTYTLKETGKEFTYNNKNYIVTESEIEFTVYDGKVTGATAKSANTKDGGDAYREGENIFVIADAQSKDTTVTISKKEMSGKDELEGAELTIFEGDKNSTKVAKDADGNEYSWTSGKTAKEVTLKDGKYTLKETGGEFTIG